MDRPVAEALVFQLDVLVLLYPPILLEIVVELLDLDRGELVQLDVPQFGDDVVIDVVQIVVLGVLPKPGLGIDLVPHLHPAFHRVGAAAVHKAEGSQATGVPSPRTIETDRSPPPSG